MFRHLFKKSQLFDMIIQYRKLNILDNMLMKLEKYATNLEEIVAQRTSDLVEEKKKTDMLLYRMLPEYVNYYYTYANMVKCAILLVKGNILGRTVCTIWALGQHLNYCQPYDTTVVPRAKVNCHPWVIVHFALGTTVLRAGISLYNTRTYTWYTHRILYFKHNNYMNKLVFSCSSIETTL